MTTLIKNTLFAASICAGFIYSSCCLTNDCIAGSQLKIIRFFSPIDTSDYIISHGIWLDSSLTITPLFIGEPKVDPEILISQSSDFQYAINIGVNENIRGFEFRLDNLPPDTLFVEVGHSPKSKCCPGVPIFDKITLNGVELPNTFGSTISIQK